jgi:hypothetical protein
MAKITFGKPLEGPKPFIRKRIKPCRKYHEANGFNGNEYCGLRIYFYSDEVKQAYIRMPKRKFKLAVKANCDSLNQELGITLYKGNNKVLKCSYPFGSHTFTVGSI